MFQYYLFSMFYHREINLYEQADLMRGSTRQQCRSLASMGRWRMQPPLIILRPEKIYAKTGTSMQADMNGDVMILAKGLAGYMTTKSGRKVAFALYANDIRISDFGELAELNTDMASIPGAFFEEL
jgi:hypothetical protein